VRGKKHADTIPDTDTSDDVQHLHERVRELEQRESRALRLELELDATRKLFRAVIDTPPVYVVAMDGDGYIRVANTLFCQAIGLSCSEVEGSHFRDIVPSRLLADHLPLIRRCLDGSGSFFDGHNTSGPFPEYAHGLYSPVSAEDGMVTGLILVVVDVSDMKRAERAANSSERELRRINAMKDRFFSIVAHDLRGPVRGIRLLARTMVTDLDDLDTSQIRKNLLEMEDAAAATQRLLANLRDWASVESGALPYRPECLSVPDLVNESVDSLMSQIHQKALEFDTAFDEGLQVYADRHMVETIIRNLASNAIKFTPREGAICIVGRRTGLTVDLTVKDTGGGIPDEVIPDLFRIDSRYHTPGTERELGSRIGLVLVKALVKQNHGHIRAESEEGIGSAFTGILPASAPDEKGAQDQ
jgi:PAS domain S-box-containing protein